MIQLYFKIAKAGFKSALRLLSIFQDCSKMHLYQKQCASSFVQEGFDFASMSERLMLDLLVVRVVNLV